MARLAASIQRVFSGLGMLAGRSGRFWNAGFSGVAIADCPRVAEAVEVAFVCAVNTVGEFGRVIISPIVMVGFVDRDRCVAPHGLARIQMVEDAEKIRVKSFHLSDQIK